MNDRSDRDTTGERAYYAGATTGHGTRGFLGTLAACSLALGGWILWSGGRASMAASADAASPPQSARTIEKRAEAAADRSPQAFDAGAQRERLISEVRALRSDVGGLRSELAALRATLEAGRVKVEVVANRKQ